MFWTTYSFCPAGILKGAGYTWLILFQWSWVYRVIWLTGKGSWNSEQMNIKWKYKPSMLPGNNHRYWNTVIVAFITFFRYIICWFLWTLWRKMRNSCSFPQWRQSGKYGELIFAFILVLFFQTFLAYLFIAIACSLILEGHGPSHEVVPEVNILTFEVVFNFFSSGLRFWAWIRAPERCKTHHFSRLHGRF